MRRRFSPFAVLSAVVLALIVGRGAAQSRPVPTLRLAVAVTVAERPPLPTPASLELVVPETAEVWINEAKSGQTGGQRLFATPALEHGLTYAYDIVVRWYEEGVPVTWSEAVPVRAGARVVVDVAERLQAQRPRTVVRDSRPMGATVARWQGPAHMVVEEFTERNSPLGRRAASPQPSYSHITELERPRSP